MQNITQPFVNLTTAQTALFTNFAQSPEMAELASHSAQKYFELVQESVGRVAASDAYTDLVRRLTEIYSTFTKEYSETLTTMAAESQNQFQQQVREVSDRMVKSGEATVTVVNDAAEKVGKPMRVR